MLNFLIIFVTETFALIGGSINENLCTYNVTKWNKHLHKFGVSKFLR